MRKGRRVCRWRAKTLTFTVLHGPRQLETGMSQLWVYSGHPCWGLFAGGINHELDLALLVSIVVHRFGEIWHMRFKIWIHK